MKKTTPHSVDDQEQFDRERFDERYRTANWREEGRQYLAEGRRQSKRRLRRQQVGQRNREPTQWERDYAAACRWLLNREHSRAQLAAGKWLREEKRRRAEQEREAEVADIQPKQQTAPSPEYDECACGRRKRREYGQCFTCNEARKAG